MEQTIASILNEITSVMSNFGFISGVLLIILESMIPVLPLSVFIALNIITFGRLFGFLISWISTVIGCMIAFFICRKLKDKYDKKYKKDKDIGKFRKTIDKLSYTNLVLIIALPFTPAFAVNIGAGLSNISPKKYFAAIMVGKIPMVYFWGFIGKSFLESITDIYTIMQIIVLLIIAYLVSKVVSKFIGG